MDVSHATPSYGDIQSYYANGGLSAADKKDPAKIAGQFEAMFFRMMFQEMREAKLADGLFDSSEGDQVMDMHYDELSNFLGGQGHLGIKDLVLGQIAKTDGSQTALGLVK